MSNYVWPLLSHGAFASALFIIVMYMGALPNGTKAIKRLMPIRAELSITASLLALGHNIAYGRTYFVRLFTGHNIAYGRTYFVRLFTDTSKIEHDTDAGGNLLTDNDRNNAAADDNVVQGRAQKDEAQVVEEAATQRIRGGRPDLCAHDAAVRANGSGGQERLYRKRYRIQPDIHQLRGYAHTQGAFEEKARRELHTARRGGRMRGEVLAVPGCIPRQRRLSPTEEPAVPAASVANAEGDLGTAKRMRPARRIMPTART